jgi:hypothetical protein
MPASSYTLLDAMKTIGFRVGNFKQNIETVANGDLATINMVENINEVVSKIVEVKGLPAMNGRCVISTVGAVATGVVDTISGDSLVSGTGTAWTSALVGAAIGVNAYNSIYRVTAVNSPTELEMDKGWSDVAVNNGAYTIAQDRYDLPSDFYDFIAVSMEGGSSRQMTVKRASEIEFQRYSLRGTALLTGTPNTISIFDRGQDGNWQAQLDPFPSDGLRLQVMYRKRVTRMRNDNDTIPLPDEVFPLLVRGATANWKEFTGIQGFEGAYKKWIADELAFYASFDQRSTDERPAIVPANVMRQPTTSGLGSYSG